MKNKSIALAIILTIMISVFSGITLVANADSPNLLEMYGLNHTFDDGVLPWTTYGATIEQCDEDSSDDDDYCAKITGRTTNYSTARLMGDAALSMFTDQGAGKYYYSFYAKCASSSASCTIYPVFQLNYGGAWSSEAAANGTVVGKWPKGTAVKITGKGWTKLEMEVDVALEIDGKALTHVILYSIQQDFSSSNAPSLLIDDVTFIKRGSYINVTPEPEVTIPSQRRVKDVKPSDRTGIGAIYYQMWYETYENWWKYDNKYIAAVNRNSSQEARCLSPKAYHYRLPFFATVNTSVTKASTIVGDISAGVAEFPEFTEAIWKQEMEYAIDAGIDFMAYLWSQKSNQYGASAYNYHIKTKGLGGRIKMCAILQEQNQDLNAMAKAMCESYWYTIDGMPVVYIYGAKDAATEEFILAIRKKLAIAQYVKYGKVGEPAYIIGMGMNSYSTAVGVSSRGIDAAGWYAFNASSHTKSIKTAGGKSVKQGTYSSLVSNAKSTMESVSRVANNNYMGVSPLISLGYNTTPRIDNPATWNNAETSLAYGGKTVADPTAQEITLNVANILNWNKTNKNVFRANTVLIYAWNEFDEGGWLCPTAAVDSNGNLLKNADGTNKVNREYLDAVKTAIKAYRSANGEAFNVTFEVEPDEEPTTPTPTTVPDDSGTNVDGDASLETEATASASATATAEPTKKPGILGNVFNDLFNNDDDDTDNADGTDNVSQDKQSKNALALLLPIGAAIIVAAGAVVVVIVLKKKKNANQAEATEE